MTIDQIMVLGGALVLGFAAAFYARWSQRRLERDDPARRGPAE